MIGIILAVIASLLVGATTTLQKYALSKINKLKPRKVAKSRLWQFSVVIGIFSGAAYIFALRYESIVVVQPIIAASFIIPVVAGKYIFGERIGSRWFHIFLIHHPVFYGGTPPFLYLL